MSIPDSKSLVDIFDYPFFFHDFLMWTSFKVLIEFVTISSVLVWFWPQGMWDLSFPTRDQSCTPCMGRQNLNHWITGEVHWLSLENLTAPPPPHHHTQKKALSENWIMVKNIEFLVYSWYSIGIAQVNDWSTESDTSGKKYRRRNNRIAFAVFIPHVAIGDSRNKAFSYVICQELLVQKAAADVDASKANHCYLAQWEHFSSSC